MLYDSEFPIIINEIFSELFKIKEFIIRVNNRKILEGLFNCYGISDTKVMKTAINVIDDMEKVPLTET